MILLHSKYTNMFQNETWGIDIYPRKKFFEKRDPGPKKHPQWGISGKGLAKMVLYWHLLALSDNIFPVAGGVE